MTKIWFVFFTAHVVWFFDEKFGIMAARREVPLAGRCFWFIYWKLVVVVWCGFTSQSSSLYTAKDWLSLAMHLTNAGDCPSFLVKGPRSLSRIQFISHELVIIHRHIYVWFDPIRQVIYFIRNNRGPRTYTCGTPLVTVAQLQKTPLPRVHCSLPVRLLSILRGSLPFAAAWNCQDYFSSNLL